LRREALAIAIVVLMAGSAVAGFVASGSIFSAPNTYTATSILTTTREGSAETQTITSTITSNLVSTVQTVVTVASGQLGPWNKTASYYPGASPPSSCVTADGYIYCVGGDGNSTYYALVSSDGVGRWAPGTNYPVPIQSESCVASGNEIYCVGGVSQGRGNQTSDRLGRTSAAFHAPISASGFGKWGKTTSYPYIAASPRCMASSAYIYCLESAFNGTVYTGVPEAYYAALSSNGIGRWMQTNATPSMTAGCSAIGGYAYCFGGVGCAPEPGDCYSPSYSSPISSNGIGKWNLTTDLPTAGYANYVTAGSYIYYLSVPVFYAHVANGTIGAWETTTNFPDGYPGPCSSYSAYLYCVDDGNNDFYFSQVGAPNPNAFVLLNPPPYPRAEYLAPAWSGSGGCGVSAGGKFSGTPCFSLDIDEAVIFDCAVEAGTSSGCKTMVISPTNTTYNYNLTIWYPEHNSSFPDTNCELLPTFVASPPIHAWCISISQDSFIVAQQITLRSGQP
jgi:hypothetical protein